jgi:coenzyme F420-0:L-glutamate ligase/coenzyme F420-1:gamma-L-glutamate ligase
MRMKHLKKFTAIALEDFPFVGSGDDVAKIIIETAARNNVEIEDQDVIAVAQKIFSKAEGRVFQLRDVIPSERARKTARIVGRSPKLVELVLQETRKILKASREALLVKDKRGLVCINAGIDKSNVKGGDSFALLPVNPDESARACRSKIKQLTGRNVAVIVCDTYSRPFRRGQVNFAIGLAGIYPFKDYRGKRDLFGRIIRVKRTAVADEVAAAAELLMGQAKEATPVVIFKGLNGLVDFCEECSIQELFISQNEDLFANAL